MLQPFTSFSTYVTLHFSVVFSSKKQANTQTHICTHRDTDIHTQKHAREEKTEITNIKL